MGGRNAAQFHGVHVAQCDGGLRVAVGPSRRMGCCDWLGRLVYSQAQAADLADLAKRLLLLLEQGDDFLQLSLRLAKRAVGGFNYP